MYVHMTSTCDVSPSFRPSFHVHDTSVRELFCIMKVQGQNVTFQLFVYYDTGAFTPWWHVQFCWLPIVNSRTLPYLRPVLDSSQWDGSSGVVYQCNWKKLRAISVTYFPNQSILCYILLCPPAPVMLCFWYTTDIDCPHQALSVSDKNNKFDQLLALGMPFLKRT